MIREGSEDDFYIQSANRLNSARGCAKAGFFSTTPTLLLATELSSPARSDYRQEVVRAVKEKRLAATYCFAWSPTAERLRFLFGRQTNKWWGQVEQLAEVKSLLIQGIINLRSIPTLGFPSGLVMANCAMLHYKDADGLRTTRVEFIEGPEAAVYVKRLEAMAEHFDTFREEDLARLIEVAREACLTELYARRFKDMLIALEGPCARVEAREQEVLRALELPSVPRQDELGRRLRRIAKAVGLAGELCRDAVAAVLDERPGLSCSADRFLKPRSRRNAGQREIRKKKRVIFERTKGSPPANGIRMSASCQSLVLRHLILHQDEWIHTGIGFFLFERWQRRKNWDYFKRFNNMLSQAKASLRHRDETLSITTEAEPEHRLVKLTGCSFDSDVAEAAQLLSHAHSHVLHGRIDEAISAAQSAITILPELAEAHALLASCWIEKSLEGYTPDPDSVGATWAVLAQELRTTGTGVRALHSYLHDCDPGIMRLIRDKMQHLVDLRKVMSRISSWLPKELRRSEPRDQELLHMLKLMSTMADPKRQCAERNAAGDELIKSSFWKDIEREVAGHSRENPEECRSDLPGAIFDVLTGDFATLPQLKRYMVKTLKSRAVDRRRGEAARPENKAFFEDLPDDKIVDRF